MRKPRNLALVAGALTLFVAAGTAVAVGNTDDSRTPATSSTTATASSSTTTDTTTTDTTPTVVGSGMSADDAGRIARDRVGGGQVTQVERETEHGRPEWKVRLADGGGAYEVRVDADTGTVTRVEADRRGGGGSSNDDVGDDKGGNRGRGGDDGPGHR